MKFSWLKKTFGALALSSTMLLGVAPGTALAADSGATLNVVTDPSFVPFEMMNENTGKMEGFDIDILKAVAKRAGFNYTLKTMNFNGIIPALQAGSADMALAGITITKQREKIVDFSNPYYNSGLKILIRDNEKDIHTFADLSGKKVGTKIGSTSYDYLKKNLKDASGVTPYPGSSNMYMALLSGSVDAVFYDAPNVSYFAKTRGQGKVKTVGKLYEGQQYGIALKKGSPWLGKVNQALATMKADGTYNKIYKKWFGHKPDKM